MTQNPEFFFVIGRKEDVVKIQLWKFPVNGPVKNQGRCTSLFFKLFYRERNIFKSIPVKVKYIDVADHNI